jgi:hypothetical protein
MLDLARERFEFLESTLRLRRTENRRSLENWLKTVTPIRWTGERIALLGVSWDRDRNLSFYLRRVGRPRRGVPREVSLDLAYSVRTGNRLMESGVAEMCTEMGPGCRTAGMIERAAPFLKREMTGLVLGDYRLLVDAMRWARAHAT